MVKKPALPDIAWEENFQPEDEARVADHILRVLLARLPPPPPQATRLFFFIPTPTPYADAETRFLAASQTGTMAGRQPRTVTLPRGGKCYVVAGADSFRKLLPHAFHLGPPELTFIAADCPFDLDAGEAQMAGFVLAALTHRATAGQHRVGMHFDSGDLVELF